MPQLRMWSEFFLWSRFDIPSSGAAPDRIHANLAYFESNYVAILILLHLYYVYVAAR